MTKVTGVTILRFDCILQEIVFVLGEPAAKTYTGHKPSSEGM